MSDDLTPRPEHHFTFGLWTVGNPGRDPFGHEVRPPLDPVDVGAPPRRARRLRRELPRRRPRAVRLVAGRARGDRQALPQRARRDRHEGADGDDEPVLAARCSRRARSPPTTRTCGASRSRKTLDAIDLGVELGAEVYVMWGGREGVEADAAKDVARSRSTATRKRSTSAASTSATAGYDLRVRARAQAQRAARRHLPADRRPRARVHRRARVARHGRAQPGVRPRDDVGPVVPPRGRADAVAREALPHRPQRAAHRQVRPGLPLRLRGHPRRVLPR